MSDVIENINWTRQRRLCFDVSGVMDMCDEWKIALDNGWHRVENNNCPVCKCGFCIYEVTYVE